MNPSVEVLPPEDPREKRRLTPALITVAPALPDESKKAGKTPLEKDIHRAALAYYFALGKDRTLEKVAQHFNMKKSLVERWSMNWDWKTRISNLENRNKSDLFKDQVADLLLLLMTSLTKPDEKTGTPVLASSAKTTAETIKLCVSAFKEIRQDAREGEPGADDSGKGPRKNGRVPGVMVNVNIRGLGDKET